MSAFRFSAALAKAHPNTEFIGFDIDAAGVDELRKCIDSAGEVEPESLVASGVEFTTDDASCSSPDIVIVAVPIPVDRRHRYT